MPNLSDFISPDGSVHLHHYASANGSPDELELDTNRFGESPWSKAEKKAEGTNKVFFYLNPKDKESFLEGRDHYHTKVDQSKIYDLMADPKKIVSRIAQRPPFNLSKVLHIVHRLGYHGVFYSGSFPTVAMLKNTKVSKVKSGGQESDQGGLEPPTHLARKPWEDDAGVWTPRKPEGWITPEGKYIENGRSLVHDDTAAIEFPEAADPRQEAFDNGYMHVAHDKDERGTFLAGYHPNGNFTANQLHKLRSLAKDYGLDAFHIEQLGKSRKIQLARTSFDTGSTPGSPNSHVQFEHNGLRFVRKRISPLHGPTWTVFHKTGSRVMSGPEFSGWVKALPPTIKSGLVGKIKSALTPTRPIKLALGNTTDIHGIKQNLEREDHKPDSPMHSILADAMEDAGDPRHEIVRHSLESARKLGDQGHNFQIQNQLDFNEHKKAQELSGNEYSIGNMYYVPGYSIPGLNPDERFWIRHHRGPRGSAFNIQYSFSRPPDPENGMQENGMYPEGQTAAEDTHAYHQTYSKTMQVPEFRDWLSKLSKEQKQAFLKDLISKGTLKPVKLGRSGYGYCFECKAPFIRHDKKAMMVHCPNGHKRRYLGRTPKPGELNKLARNPRRLPDGWMKPDGTFIDNGEKTHTDTISEHFPTILANPSSVAYSAGWMHVGSDEDADKGGTFFAGYHPTRGFNERQILALKGLARKHGASHVYLDGSSKSTPVKLAATRAPQGGAIVNNQYHVGGQFLPRAFKRISRVVAQARKYEKVRALKLARTSQVRLR